MPILKRILVATDLSAAAHRAVMRAGQLASQWGADLCVVRARPDWHLFARGRVTSPVGHQDIARGADNPLRAVLADLEAKFGIHADPDFLDHRDRRGHICWIQQSTLAREDLANFSGFKMPSACMVRGSYTSCLAGGEGRTHDPQRSTRLAVPVSRAAGSK